MTLRDQLALLLAEHDENEIFYTLEDLLEYRNEDLSEFKICVYKDGEQLYPN